MSRSTEENTLQLNGFVGGLNNIDHPSSIADTECIRLENFEVQTDGTLRSRPHIRKNTTPDAPDLEIIGTVVNPTTGSWYLIGATSAATYYSLRGESTWTSLVGRRMLACVQYGGKVYFTSYTGSGGYWDFTTWTDDANIPQGHKIISHKSRLWVVPGVNNTPSANTSRLQFSDPIVTTPVWTATNIIDVQNGDGTNLVDVVVYNDDLMLFKESATYIYAFDLLPEDGVIREVNSVIGASSKHCVKEYQNSLFVFHENSVYEVQNYNFIKLNEKVRFEGAATIDAHGSFYYFSHLSVVDDRLIVKNFDHVYSYDLLTQTWSEWTSDTYTIETFGPWWKTPVETPNGLPTMYMACNYDTSATDDDIYILQAPTPDGYAAVTHETFTCYFTTKYFDFNDPVHFKRMKWVGIDTTYPNLFSFYVYREGNTDTAEMSAVSVDGTAQALDQRKTLRIGLAFRFKTCYFHVEATAPGTAPQEDIWIYGLTAVLTKRQTISGQVNI